MSLDISLCVVCKEGKDSIVLDPGEDNISTLELFEKFDHLTEIETLEYISWPLTFEALGYNVKDYELKQYMDGIYYTFIKIEDPSISLTIEDPNFKTQKVTVKILNYKCISGHGSGMNSSFYDYLYGDDRDDETKRKRFVSSKKDVLKHYVPNGHSYLRSWHDNWTDKTFIINSW